MFVHIGLKRFELLDFGLHMDILIFSESTDSLKV